MTSQQVVTAFVVAGVAGVAVAQPVQTIVQTVTIGNQATDFVDSGSIALFDDMGGTRELVAVCIDLSGSVNGSAGAENQSTTDLVDVDLTLQAEISASFGGLDLAQVFPLVNSGIIGLDTFDNNLDFAGTSGVTFAGMNTDSISVEFLSTDGGLAGVIFASFIGMGTASLDVDADGDFDANATSSSGQTFVTQTSELFAEASVTVTYKYIPAPGAAALGVVVGLAATRRRR